MLSTETLDMIRAARTVRGRVPWDYDVPYQNIGELLWRNARTYDEKPYLIYYTIEGERTELSYKEFFAAVMRCANLLKRSGIRRGDRIATVSHNHFETVIQYYAAWMLGVVIVPVNVGEDDERIKFILEHSKTKLAFVRSQYVERLEKAGAISENVIVVVCEKKHNDVKFLFFDEEMEASSSVASSDEAVTLEDQALIVYTSGTTGMPKGVVLIQYNLLIDAKAITDWFSIKNSHRMMCVLPIHHVNGTVVTTVSSMYAGATLVLNQKFQTDKFFERLEKEKIDITSVVPTLLAFLLQHYSDTTAPKNFSTLKIICGAGPLTVELGAQFENRFGIPISHGYGLSETTCYSCFLPLTQTGEEHKRWMRDYGFPSIGVPVPCNEMTIHDEHGAELPEGERGEIVIRGHNVMKYYYDNDEANEKTFAHGWFRSGDEGFYKTADDGRKYFFITGRLKELIIRGGVNISPLEIDEVLAEIPGVRAAIAVGFENDFYGEEVGAYVSLRDGVKLSADDVLRLCRKKLPHHKTPKVVVFGDDIPVTSTGKYQRNRCKHLFVEWKTAQFRK